MSEPKLKVVLCWHMHQPQYRDLVSGNNALPWTYLHGIKDYVDMAGILEEAPAARAVVNFTPVLLDQLEAYGCQIAGFLKRNEPLHDALLSALGAVVLPASPEARLELIHQCLHANERHMIKRYPAYALLVDLAKVQLEKPELLTYVNEQFLFDLIVWYHLAWLGETVKRGNKQVQALIEKSRGFTLHERLALLEFLGGLLSDIIPRYRRLKERGQIELALSPQDHPMLPLLYDFAVAREAEPDIQLPALSQYPGAEARVRWHLQEGLKTFLHHFGFAPVGCWPSEGGVSNRVLSTLASEGFRWVGSGEKVLDHSLLRYEIPREDCKHHPYAIKGIDTKIFFRDDNLSDLIGFHYAKWSRNDAVANFVHHLENIDLACQGCDERVVSVIMDGENAWEYYPANGYDFLKALYQAVIEHPRLELSTFSDCLFESSEPIELPGIVAGSWVYGNFSTWIGHPDKNRAWELLGEAKQQVDSILAGAELPSRDHHLILQQLGVCEASDWFWWLGDYNSADSVGTFERLFRHHLANLYFLLGVEPPEHLTVPLSHGSGHPEQAGTMRRTT